MNNRGTAITLMTHYFKSVWTKAGMRWEGDNEVEIIELVDALLTPVGGTPGTGECICMQTPAYVKAYAARLQVNFDLVDVNMLLDHRCPHHGEKAQPALWGRHKDKVLTVTPKQWLSLGVER